MVIKMRLQLTLLVLALVASTCAAFESNDYWRQEGANDLQRALKKKINDKVAKNVVLMIGDGMGISTITAGRIYKGQKLGQTGEEYKLSFETFSSVALSKTYNLDRQVPDSAGTATAILTGVKVNMATIGVDGDVPFGNCSAYTEARNLKSVLDYALEAGKSVGIVTTTRITHATPASTFGHSPDRDYESDVDLQGTTGCEHVKDLAYQLVMENPNISVILGGGRRAFINNTTPDPGTGEISSKQRLDGLDLREEWKAEKTSRGVSHAYVETKDELLNVDPNTTDYLFGLFSSSHMSYELERDSSGAGQPSLVEMAEKAIQILSKNPAGFFLLLEGGRIDHAHHENYAKKALEELSVFDDAVATVRNLTDVGDTLQIVTADHSHTFSIAGYPSRGNNILGLVDKVGPSEQPKDGLPYLTLTYANGPKYGRTDLTNVDTTADDFQQPGCIEMDSETHSGEEVAIYAEGPRAHLFHTTHEQSYIAHVIMYATCTGDYASDCQQAGGGKPARGGKPR